MNERSENVVRATDPIHWRDKRCIACNGELPLPTWAGQPYICCSGRDCGCGGGVLPIEFCSVDCWENYDPTPWCSGGHMTEASCTCGEIDSHD